MPKQLLRLQTHKVSKPAQDGCGEQDRLMLGTFGG